MTEPSRLDLVTVTEFAELLSATTTSAIHLEMRDAYTPHAQGFQRWLAGYRADQADRESWWRPFHTQVAAAVARGVRMRRARIVSEPPTPFIRYEYDVTYQNITAGEAVRWLPRRRASDLALPGNDFWVFDDRLIRFHHFSGEGDVVGDELVRDPAVVDLCVTAFEAVWARAVDHEDYRLT